MRACVRAVKKSSNNSQEKEEVSVSEIDRSKSMFFIYLSTLRNETKTNRCLMAAQFVVVAAAVCCGTECNVFVRPIIIRVSASRLHARYIVRNNSRLFLTVDCPFLLLFCVVIDSSLERACF